MKTYLNIFIICFFCSCNNTDNSSEESHEQIKKNIIENYIKHRNEIQSYLNYNERYKYIKGIRFEDNSKVIIESDDIDSKKIGYNNDIWHQKYSSKDVQRILFLEQMNTDSLIRLKQSLDKIHSISIGFIPDYIEDEKQIYQIEFCFKRLELWSYYFKVFKNDFDSSKIEHFTKFLIKKDQGGILDKNVIWYYHN